MNEQLVVVFIGAIANAALWMFYKSFEVEWPERYYDGLRGADPLVTRTSGRYAVFRVLPFLLSIVVAGAAADRVDVSRTGTVWLTTALYVGLGPLPKAVSAWFGTPRSVGSAVHRFGTAIALTVAAEIYLWTGSRLDRYVPSLENVVFAAFIAIFVFMLGRLSILFSTIQSPSDGKLVQRAIEEIDPDLISRLVYADPARVFLTVAVVEQLNRPNWVRRIERLVPGMKTQGLMQMRSRRSITDEESVDQFIAKHRARTGRETWGEGERRKFFRRHNPSTEFNEMANRIYYDVLFKTHDSIPNM